MAGSAPRSSRRASTRSGAKAPSSPAESPAPSLEDEPRDDRAVPTCTVGFCPICLAVTAMQPIAPDVLEHLLNAGREFLLAARSVMDARADAVGPDERKARLEKIDIG